MLSRGASAGRALAAADRAGRADRARRRRTGRVAAAASGPADLPATAATATAAAKPAGWPSFLIGASYQGPAARSWRGDYWAWWAADLFDAQLVSEDFARASAAGLNTLRVFVQLELLREIREDNWTKLDTVMDLADQHGLRLILTLGDYDEPRVARLATHRRRDQRALRRPQDDPRLRPAQRADVLGAPVRDVPERPEAAPAESEAAGAVRRAGGQPLHRGVPRLRRGPARPARHPRAVQRGRGVRLPQQLDHLVQALARGDGVGEADRAAPTWSSSARRRRPAGARSWRRSTRPTRPGWSRASRRSARATPTRSSRSGTTIR